MLWYKVVTLYSLIQYVHCNVVKDSFTSLENIDPACSFTEPLQFIGINKCYKLETSLSCEIFILNHAVHNNCITLLLSNWLYCSKILQLFNDIHLYLINGEM